ncbi:hypothetical protein H8958_002972 [Nasalis larvatus]
MDLKESPSEGSLQPSSIQIFANTSTLHGIRHIFVYGPLTIRRVLWAVAFVGSLGLLLVESSERVSYYFSYQHVTKVDEVVAQSLVFPAVTLCNLNGFRFSRLTTNDLYHAGELLALLDVNLQIPDPHLADPSVLEALRQKANFKHYKPKQFSMLEFLHRVGHDLKDMMLYCKFKGQECGHQDFTTLTLDVNKCDLQKKSVFTQQVALSRHSEAQGSCGFPWLPHKNASPAGARPYKGSSNQRHYDPPAKSPEIKLLGHKRWRLKFQDSTYSCHKSFQNACSPTPGPTASPRETRVPKCPSEKNGEARPKVICQWASTQAFTRSDPDSQTVQGLLFTWSHLVVPVPALPLRSESENLICALRRRLVVLLTKSWTGDLVIDPKTIITNPSHIQERDQMHSLLKVAKNMAGLYGFAIRCFHCSMCSALKSNLTRERGPLPSTGSDSEGCIVAVFHGNRFQEEHHRRSAGSEDFQSAPKLSQTKRRVAGFTASAGTKGRGYDVGKHSPRLLQGL